MVSTFIARVAFFGVFLLNFLLRFYKGKRVKILYNCTLAKRSLGTGTLIITTVVVVFPRIFQSVAFQKHGNIDPLSTYLPYGIGSLLLGFYIYPKILRFKNGHTLGDIVGQMYGRNAQLVTGMLSIFTSIILIGPQLVAVKLASDILGLPPTHLVCLIGIAAIAYTLLGGIRSVAATDVFRLSLAFIGFAFIAYKVLNGELMSAKGGRMAIQGTQALFKIMAKKANNGNMNTFKMIGHPGLLKKAILIFPLTTVLVRFSPAIINRVLVPRKKKQVKNTFFGFAVLHILFNFLLKITRFGILLAHVLERIRSEDLLNKTPKYTCLEKRNLNGVVRPTVGVILHCR